MSIKFINERGWGFYFSKQFGVMAINLGLFGIQFIYRKGGIDVIKWRENAIEQRKRMDEQFNKVCEVCQKPLDVNSFGQIVKYHKECRKLRKYVPKV